MTKDELIEKLFGSDTKPPEVMDILKSEVEAMYEQEKPYLDHMKLWTRKYPHLEVGDPNAAVMTYTEDGVEYLCDVEAPISGNEPNLFIIATEPGKEPVEIFRTGQLCCFIHTILAGVKATMAYIELRKAKPNPNSRWAQGD